MPLALDGEVQLALEPLGDDDAVALFVERVRAVQPLFTDAEHEGLVELCRHLDGLPLAIELAAARAKTLAVPQIASMLERRFELLRSASRAGPSRHEGLRTAIDASYELLFADDQRAFRALSVFAGGATLEAARVVCGPDALDLVTRLVDRSLLVADTSGPESRFRMLESLRQYGTDRLAELGELEAAVVAHIDWCVTLAKAAEPEIRGRYQLRWLERLDAEHDNLRAALAAATVVDPETALRLIAVLILPWWFRGRRHEARHWAEAALAAASRPPSQDHADVLA
jgi:predicted ATPase